MAISIKRLTIVWVLLIALTLTSVDFVAGAGAPIARTLAVPAVIVLAYAKVRMVGLEYMELRFAPIALRLAFEVWALTIASAILAVHFLAE